MANLAPFEFEKIGDFMRKLCRDRAKCERMAKDMDFATKEFSAVVKMPGGHQIKVHLDEVNVTHVIIPLQAEVEEAEKTFQSGADRVYPVQYKTDPLLDISEREEPMRAFSFLLGEYTMRRCKK
jgi:hypothetical protein